MIQAFELVLLQKLKDFWDTTITNIGTANDVIPDIFAGLPADGDGGANWKAIGETFTKFATGNPQDDVSFILQFPATKAQIPTICIEVGTEAEDEVVGSFIEEGLNPDIQKIERKSGGIFTKTYAVGIHSFNADATLYLYSLVKYGLLILRNSLEGVSNIAISGRPMTNDFNTYNPEIVYSRYLDIRVEGLLDSAIERFDIVKHTDAEAV